MKELTIEEKAERYDEAIKVAKGNYETIVQMDNDCTFAKEGIVNTFHHIFPELKENEDEKVRKGIIKSIMDLNTNWLELHGITKKNAIAWIEKQGEKPTSEEMKEVLHTEYEKGRADIIAEMQKLAWSEEDKTMVEGIIEAIDTQYAVTDYNEMVNWLKSLKDRVQPQFTWKPSDEQMNNK